MKELEVSLIVGEEIGLWPKGTKGE